MTRAGGLLGATLALLTACSQVMDAAATGTKRPGDGALSGRSYAWYDGDQERQVWLNPRLLAEFSRGAPAGGQVRRAYPGARAVDAPGLGVRFWELGQGVSPEAASRALNARDPRAGYSPVLHDGPGPSGRKRALPGNVIVYLNPAWDRAAVERWARERDLAIVKKLEIGANVFVLKTGPGLEALDTANRLYRSREVVAAFPDWWLEAVPR